MEISFYDLVDKLGLSKQLKNFFFCSEVNASKEAFANIGIDLEEELIPKPKHIFSLNIFDINLFLKSFDIEVDDSINLEDVNFKPLLDNIYIKCLPNLESIPKMSYQAFDSAIGCLEDTFFIEVIKNALINNHGWDSHTIDNDLIYSYWDDYVRHVIKSILEDDSFDFNKYCLENTYE